MKKVPIHTLKQELASVIAEAEAGMEIVITRHNKSVARLIDAGGRHLHRGVRFGKASLKPAVRGNTGGRYLELLKQDRYADSE